MANLMIPISPFEAEFDAGAAYGAPGDIRRCTVVGITDAYAKPRWVASVEKDGWETPVMVENVRRIEQEPRQ